MFSPKQDTSFGMNQEDADIFSQGAAGLALAASALAEAAQALSEAAAALSAMSHEKERPVTMYQALASTSNVLEDQEADELEDQAQDIDDDSSSISDHGGNNALGSHSVAQLISNDFPRSSDPTSHSPAERESLSGQGSVDTTPLSGLPFPGCFYVVLEEEFDALPLIRAYATAAKRITCYVPTSGSLFPWESILSAIIPDRQVRSAISFSGKSIMQLNDVVQYLASSEDGSVLVLRSTFIPRANENNAHSISDSIIFWGLPGPKYWPSLMQATQQSKHTLLILNEREYCDRTCQSFLTTQGLSTVSRFVAHPQHSEINSFEPDSVLAGFRDKVQRIIPRAQHSQNIQTIYEELVESPIDNTAQLNFLARSSTERIDLTNKFMARVFLRGRVQDGSSRFTFNGQGLQIPERSYKRLGNIFGTNTQLNQPTSTSGTGVPVKPGSQGNQNDAAPVNLSAITHRPGRWRITVQQDADIIPLLCYLAHHHPKSLCSVSHSCRAAAYTSLFKRICTYAVIAPGKKQTSVESTLKDFSSASQRSGLCLLRGNSAESCSNFNRVKADALIYWGLPANGSFLWPTGIPANQFRHIYLIISPDQSSTITNPLIASSFEEHPDSALLNAQGPGSPLHLMRERVRPVLQGLSHNQLKTISKASSVAAAPFSGLTPKLL